MCLVRSQDTAKYFRKQQTHAERDEISQTLSLKDAGRK